MINRRQWLCGMGVMASAAAQPGSAFAASKEETQQTVSQFAEPCGVFSKKHAASARDAFLSERRTDFLDSPKFSRAIRRDNSDAA